MNKKLFQWGGLCALIIFSLFFGVSTVRSESSSDAIAIRVVPNTEHYSIERWYQAQGFTGSPQALTVDGYQAIRDGRTVYVNASNIDVSNDYLYTNIYLISYNQDSEQSTVDILGQIISHWRFNHNLTGSGKCALSSLACVSDDECPSGYVCGNEQQSFQTNKCVLPDDTIDLSETRNCLGDNDCPSGLSCTSLKSRVVRDVRRLGQITEVKLLLEEYQSSHGYYPKLSSGTYLSGISISTWPSWQAVLTQELQASSNLVDPINALGSCPGNFNYTTCWNEDSQTFYDSDPYTNMDLPANSFVYTYSTNSNGVDYDICANMESPFDTQDGQVSNNNCNSAIGYFGQFDNQPPVLVSYNLGGSNQEVFNGFIKVLDPEGDPLTWQLNTSATTWTNWSAHPVLQNTDNPNQKRVYAQKAGNNGTYPISITVTDNEGNALNENLDIEISNLGPQIQAEDINYVMDSGNPLSFTLYINDDNLPVNPTSLNSNLTVTYPSDFPAPHGGTYSTTQTNIGHGLTKNFQRIANDKYRMTITGLPGDLDGSGTIDEDLNLNDNEPDIIEFTLYVEDTNGESSVKNFNINLIHSNPILNFQCPDKVRINHDYSCSVVAVNASSETTYAFETNDNPGLPVGLTDNGSGVITGSPTVSGTYNIKVTASNEYGGSDTKDFTLKVNSYCGDGVVASPNMELTGGPYNDGYENCDISAGLATTPANSSESATYECTTDSDTTYPVPQGSCTFAGGYCGDGQVQANHGEECDFGGTSGTCCYTPGTANACTWTGVSHTENLNFQGNEPETILTSGQSDNIIFPDVLGFNAQSGRLDAELVASPETTAVVYVTDISGSMPDGLTDVRDALIGTTASNPSQAYADGSIYYLHEAAINNGANIKVGLVEFGHQVTSMSINQISDQSHYVNLVNRISNYNDTGSATHTSDAVSQARAMLNSVSADNKFIVLLSDGQPSSGYDPSAIAQMAKNDGIKIYTITYNWSQSLFDDMCEWSSDPSAVCNSGNGYQYSYWSTSASSVYQQITQQILNVPSGTVYLNINGQQVSFEATGDVITNIFVDFSSVNCIPESGVCSPDIVPIAPTFNGGGSIRFFNVRLSVLDSCN